MPGLLDIIGQAMGLPTALAQQKANLLQSQQGNTQGTIQLGLMAKALDSQGLLPQAARSSLVQMGLLPPPQAPQTVGTPQQGIAPAGQQAQQPAPSTGQSLFTGAQGLINAAQPHGAQLNAPPPQSQTTQSPTGPVTTFPLMGAPAQQSPQVTPTAQTQAPSGGLLPQQQQPQQLTPMQEYQQGMGLVSNPAAQYLPFLKSRGQAMMDEAKLRLSTDPTYLTQQAVAKDQQTQDLSILSAARQSGDKDRIAQAQAKLQRDTLGGVPLTNVPGGIGGAPLAQLNTATNEYKPITQPETASFITNSGQVRMMPKAQGMAQGLTPYTPTIFGAQGMSDQAVQLAADTYRTTGKMPAAFGRNPLMQAKVLDRVAQDAAASGDTAGAINARSEALKANGQGLNQITKLETATTSYYNTLDKNLTALQQLAGKVDSSGVPVLNRVYRAWQQGVSGSPDIAQYVTYMKAVEGEYAKIQSGSLGNQGSSDAARRDAQDIINKFMSQGQINAVAEAMRGEGNNRLTSIREQKQTLMQQLGLNAPGTAQGASASAGAQPTSGQPKTVNFSDLK